jgi:hypothetical protein
MKNEELNEIPKSVIYRKDFSANKKNSFLIESLLSNESSKDNFSGAVRYFCVC